MHDWMLKLPFSLSSSIHPAFSAQAVLSLYVTPALSFSATCCRWTTGKARAQWATFRLQTKLSHLAAYKRASMCAFPWWSEHTKFRISYLPIPLRVMVFYLARSKSSTCRPVCNGTAMDTHMSGMSWSLAWALPARSTACDGQLLSASRTGLRSS